MNEVEYPKRLFLLHLLYHLIHHKHTWRRTTSTAYKCLISVIICLSVVTNQNERFPQCSYNNPWRATAFGSTKSSDPICFLQCRIALPNNGFNLPCDKYNCKLPDSAAINDYIYSNHIISSSTSQRLNKRCKSLFDQSQ